MRGMTMMEHLECKLSEPQSIHAESVKCLHDYAYYEATAEGLLTEISSPSETVFNFQRRELIGRPFSILCVEPEAGVHFLNLTKDERWIVNHELLIQEKEGLSVCCSVSGKRILNDNGGYKIVGLIRNISSIKNYLTEEIGFYRMLVENSLIGIYVIQDGVFKYINHSAAIYAGYEKEQLIGKSALSIVHHEDREELHTNARAMLKGRSSAPYEYRVITTDGQIRWITEIVHPLFFEGRRAVLGQSMNSAWTSKMDVGIVKAIIESVQDGVYLADTNGSFILANRGFEKITGIDRNELKGKHTDYLVNNNYISTAVNLKVLADKQSRTELVRYPSGKDILVSAAIIYDKNNTEVGVVSSLRDLSELNEIRKRIEDSNVVIDRCQKKLNQLEESLKLHKSKFITVSKEGRHVLTLAKKIARSDVAVLITGESGVGKDVIARFIHDESRRKNTGLFTKIDCAALPPTLLESELFGYEKGAFTNAGKEGKKGLLETANGGTAFLDEIGELNIELQSKLLTVIQDKEFKRIGGLSGRSLDVRIIVATNRDIEAMVSDRSFRKDLYYRINIIRIHIPPLRERREDIAALVDYYLDYFNNYYKTKNYISKSALECMQVYDWPGNVRELKNLLERFIIVNPNAEIRSSDIESETRNHKRDILPAHEKITILERNGSLKEKMNHYEKELIKSALSSHKTFVDAAKALKIDTSTLTRKKQKYLLM